MSKDSKLKKELFQMPESRNIKKICYISSVAFEMVSAVSLWAGAVGKLVGLSGELLGDGVSYEKELNRAISCAIYRVREESKTSMNRDIATEIAYMLDSDEQMPADLDSLIRHTQSFQERYGTDRNVREFIEVFEEYFRVEISKRQELNNWYVLSNGFETINTLKEIVAINEKELDRLDRLIRNLLDIDRTSREIDKAIVELEEKIEKSNTEVSDIVLLLRFFVQKGFNMFVFLLVAMAVFMIVNIFLHCEGNSLPMSAAISYFITDVVTAIWYFVTKEEIIPWKMVEYAISPILAIFCYVLLLTNIGVETGTIVLSALSLVLGRIVAKGLQTLWEKDQDDW